MEDGGVSKKIFLFFFQVYFMSGNSWGTWNESISVIKNYLFLFAEEPSEGGLNALLLVMLGGRVVLVMNSRRLGGEDWLGRRQVLVEGVLRAVPRGEGRGGCWVPTRPKHIPTHYATTQAIPPIFPHKSFLYTLTPHIWLNNPSRQDRQSSN